MAANRDDVQHLEDQSDRNQQDAGAAPSAEAILSPLDNAPLQGFHLSSVLLAACGWIQAGWEFAMMLNIVTIIAFTKFADSKTGLPRPYLDALRTTLYAGTLVGQLFWGFMGDRYGRKAMFLAENVYILGALVLSAVATWGPGETIVILWCVWRFLLGFGLGGEYPLVAVLTAEFACKRWRGMLVALVWACQSIGYVMSAVVGLAVVVAFEEQMRECVRGQPCVALDRVWRVLLAASCLPAIVIFLLRNWLPESPRFTLFNMMNARNAERDVLRTLALDSTSSSELSPTQLQLQQRLLLAAASRRQGFWGYVSTPKVALRLGACMVNWFLRDITFVTIMLWGSSFLSKGFGTMVTIKPGNVPGHTIYDYWRELFVGWTLLYLCTNVTGYFLGVALIDFVGRIALQMTGFALSALFMGLAAIFMPTISPQAFVIMLMMALMFANAGPNLTVFVLPAELFKTKFRCRCHSFAAASGRMGAIVVFLGLDRLMASGPSGQRQTLAVLAGLSLFGIFTTLLLPETKGRSLEEISDDTYEQPEQAGRKTSGLSRSSGPGAPVAAEVKPRTSESKVA